MKAFPYQHKNPTSGLTTESEGMTLRDYFAIHAMQALIKETDNRFPMEDIVRASWEYADEMLKTRQA